MLRVQLINNEIGGLTLADIDPGGLNDFEIELKRSKDNDGVFYEFGVNLEFNKKGREFIKAVYESQGIQGEITVNLYEYDPNTYTWGITYTGQIKLDNYELTETKLTTNIEQVGFERKFLNLLKRDVDIETIETLNGTALTPVNSITLPLAPKTIKKKAVLNGPSEFIKSGYIEIGDIFQRQIRVGGSLVSSDFDNSFLGVDGWFFDSPTVTKNYVIEATEAGEYVFDFNIDIRTYLEVTKKPLNDEADLTSQEFQIYFQINDESPTVLYDQTLVPGPYTSGAYSSGDYDSAAINIENNSWVFEKDIVIAASSITRTLNVNDEVYFWIRSGIAFDASGDGPASHGYKLNDAFNFTITGDTIFPETNTKAFLAYEFLERITQFITDQSVSFKSDFFGRTDIGYAADGAGSMLAIANGALIRGLEKTMFGNWKEAFESLSAIYCLGWGFERLEDDTQVIRCEPKEHFFDSSTTVLSLGQVAKLSKIVDRDLYYQTVEVGYPSVENINQVNGIDEFNTTRKWSSPITNSSKDLKIVSKYRASGFEIESQRRLFGTTKESNLDDKNFFVCVKRSGSDYVVLQGADFTSVTGVFDPDTAYNIPISPARMIRNWKKVISSNTLRSSDKTFKFSFGDYNYEMVSQFPGEESIDESGDVLMDDAEALWYNEEYNFETKLVKSERTLIRANQNGLISAKDWAGNTITGYIISSKVKIEDKKAKMILRRSV